MILDTPGASQAFVLTELDTCELFISLAQGTSDAAARERRMDMAQKAYESVIRYSPRINFSDAEREELQKRIAAAGKQLHDFGAARS